MTHGHDEHHGVGHIVPIRYLVATGTALLILTVITVWVAKFDFGAFNIAVALLIAGFKASLVVMFFMHQLQLMQERLVLDTYAYCENRLLRFLKSQSG